MANEHAQDVSDFEWAIAYMVSSTRDLAERILREFRAEIKADDSGFDARWRGVRGGLMLLRRVLYPIRCFLENGAGDLLREHDSGLTQFLAKNRSRLEVCNERVNELIHLADVDLSTLGGRAVVVEKLNQLNIAFNVWSDRIERDWISAGDRRSQNEGSVPLWAFHYAEDGNRKERLKREYLDAQRAFREALEPTKPKLDRILECSLRLLLRSFFYVAAAPEVLSGEGYDEIISLHEQAIRIVTDSKAQSLLRDRQEELSHCTPEQSVRRIFGSSWLMSYHELTRTART